MQNVCSSIRLGSMAILDFKFISQCLSNDYMRNGYNMNGYSFIIRHEYFRF